MPYAIVTFDKPDHGPLRASVRERHVAYLKANVHRLLAAGAMTEDDGTGGSGGINLVDTDSREEAERFIADDPVHAGRAVRESDRHALAQGLLRRQVPALNTIGPGARPLSRVHA